MTEDVTSENEEAPARSPLQFSSSLSVGVLTPANGLAAPCLVQIKLTPAKMPIEMVFETPDPGFVEELASDLLEKAKELRENPHNAAYDGQHNSLDPVEFETRLRAAVEAAQAGSASNNTDDASLEKE